MWSASVCGKWAFGGVLVTYEVDGGVFFGDYEWVRKIVQLAARFCGVGQACPWSWPVTPTGVNGQTHSGAVAFSWSNERYALGKFRFRRDRSRDASAHPSLYRGPARA